MLEAAGVELRYSTLQQGAWLDPWDQPFEYKAKKRLLLGWKVQLYSRGPNGEDDGGEGDDISFTKTLGLWKATRKAAGAFFEFLKSKDLSP